MGFTLLAGSYEILFHQLYLALPAHIQSLPDATRLLGGVLALSAVIGVSAPAPGLPPGGAAAWEYRSPWGWGWA